MSELLVTVCIVWVEKDSAERTAEAHMQKLALTSPWFCGTVIISGGKEMKRERAECDDYHQSIGEPHGGVSLGVESLVD